MTEVRRFETSQVDQRCPVCNVGWMRPTGIITETNPPQFEHKCTNCDYHEYYAVRFPYIIPNDQG